jgi:aldose 1-epimerase
MIELGNEDLQVRLTPFGARLVSLVFDGTDLIAGAADEAAFRAGDIYAGAVCGRIAGRISEARFPLDGRTIALVPTEGGDQLHGGPENFCTTVWQSHVSDDTVRFTLHSPDGDQGYPGDVDVSAVYSIDGAVLSLDLEAVTSKPTVLNLTNHAYWNIAGHGSAFELDAEIGADHYLPLKDRKLPTGEIAPVAGTPWDFRRMRKVGEAYDNCWALRGERGGLKHAITLRDPVSGRQMEVHCTECGLQFYTADHWSEAMAGKSGPLSQHCSIAIEPQNFPDAPNHPNFPSAVLRPGETYRHRIEWWFSRS